MKLREEGLGSKLFERVRLGVRLTDAIGVRRHTARRAQGDVDWIAPSDFERLTTATRPGRLHPPTGSVRKGR